MSLDPRYRLPLANKAEIDALREQKFQSLDEPKLKELDEFLSAGKAKEEEEIELRIGADGEDSDVSEFEELELSEGESDDEFADMLKASSNIESDCCITEQGDKQLEAAFSIAMETAFKAKDTKLISSESFEDIQKMLSTVFNDLNEEERKKVKDELSQNSSGLQLRLWCNVICAEAVGKEFKGKREPFCRLGLLKEQDRYTDVVKDKNNNLLEWRDANLVTCGHVCTTKPAATRLNPEWNQDFELTLTDFQQESLVVEVWCDTEQSLLKKKGERFIGRLFYRLRSNPLLWEERELTLHSHSEKHERGSITLQLHIKTTGKGSPETKTSVVCDHQLLTHVLVDLFTKKNGRHARRWDGVLPDRAKELLKYHAFLNCIDELQREYVKLAVLLSYHKLYKIETAAFCTQFEEIRKVEALPCQACPSFSPEPELIVDLFNDMERQISDWIKQFMQDSKKCCSRPKIRYFAQLYSFIPLTNRLPKDSCRSLDELVERVTTVTVANWFLEEQYWNHFTKEGKEIEPGYSFQHLMNECANQLQKGYEYLHPNFMRAAGIDFFSHYYLVFDKLIGAEGETRVYRTKDPSIYRVYCSFQRIEKLRERAGNNCSLNKHSHLDNYIHWFERSSVVTEWIQFLLEKGRRFIANSVADSKPVPITEAVAYSASASDTERLLHEVGEFWKNLSWPEPEMSSCYAAMTMIGIAECASYYVSQSAKELQLNMDELFDQKGNFISHKKLSIFLNDVDHIHTSLSRCAESESLNLRSFYDWLEDKETSLGIRCKSLIDRFLLETKKEIDYKSSRILLQIVDQMAPHMRTFLHEMVAESHETEQNVAVDTNEVCEFSAPLMDYLWHNMKNTVENLHLTVAKIFLGYLWQKALFCIQEVTKSMKDKRPLWMYAKLFRTLITLRDLFHQEGKGVPEETLKTKQFTDLHSKLEIGGLSSDKLACRYLSELSQLQSVQAVEDTDSECEQALGILNFSVVYYRETSTIEVNIIQAIDLPDFKGSHNCPSVLASLLPAWKFPHATDAKTEVQKRPQNPQIFVNGEMNL